MPPAVPREFPRVPFEVGDVDEAAYVSLEAVCRRLRFLPAFRHGILLEAAMVSPEDEAVVRSLRRLTHQEVRRFGISEPDFARALALLESKSAPATVPGEEALGGVPPVCPEAWGFPGSTAREVAVEMVRFAFLAGASDLLLDEQEEWMDVAVKVGGRKEILPPVEKGFATVLLKAFKEIAGLSTHGVAAWQSGAAGVHVGAGRRADLRIEVTPTVHGQSLVARVQDRQLQLSRMNRLPFTNPRQCRIVDACLGQTQGLIVATGPTGQGKTTTLYSCLGRLDRSLLNIRTLEDPVEFVVPWITQIPVGSGTGRTYGEGLKSLLRQAPHVILMGEIRDAAVAQTCVEAVDTGHLIFATLHTRDAVGVVARLLDLGLTGRQVATSLLLAVGQRLARRLCPHCRRGVPASASQARHFERYGLAAPASLFEPGGCPRCGGNGESGVVPLFELFYPGLDAELGEAIGQAGRETYREDALRDRWQALGGEPLVREGLELAANGQIAYAEVLRHERRLILE
jgi:type II secretory ATPase GspE/PulE/Tfp pilus assembly ATPase PilB-like protein